MEPRHSRHFLPTLFFLCLSLLCPRLIESRKSFTNIPHFSFSGGFFRQLLPTRNISILLDNLLKGYDRKLRPRFGGPPTIVEIDVEVRSMGQISEMDMTFSMDCYFRQSWVDERLAFSNTEEAFTLSLSVLERLWKPDTFIYNGKNSYTHIITTPNRFIRLHHSGKILYSSRLTIRATCPMNLEDFPMDTQRCPLTLGSFGYTTKDVLYRWNDKRQLVIAADMKLSQFDLIAAPSSYQNTTRRTDEHSTLMASFYLQRHMGNFLIQVYGPCMLLVVLSWVSFWLNREATADRISLGVTTVLTMTFLGLEARKDLPKVSYSTALDLFVWISYGFIFATIIEFAFVHYYTKFGSGEDLLSELETDSEEEMDKEEEVEMDVTKEILLEEGKDLGEGEEQLQQLYEENYQTEWLKGCNYCNRKLHLPGCKYVDKLEKGNPRYLKDVSLHSSLPRHIERTLSLDKKPSLYQFIQAEQAKSNKTTSGPIRENPLAESHTEEIIPRTLTASTEKTFDIQAKLGNKPQSVQLDLCPTCNNKLTDSQSSSSSEVLKNRKKRRKKTMCNMFLSYCYRERCNMVKARKRVKEARAEEAKRRIPKDEQMNSVSSIDEVSRVLFPLAFLFTNLLYWYAYLSHSQRLLFNLEPPKYAPSPY